MTFCEEPDVAPQNLRNMGSSQPRVYCQLSLNTMVNTHLTHTQKSDSCFIHLKWNPVVRHESFMNLQG